MKLSLGTLYVAFTILFAVCSSYVGENDAVSLLMQGTSIVFAIYRNTIKERMAKTAAEDGNPLGLTGLVLFISFFIAAGPFAPFFSARFSPENPFPYPLLGAAVIYWVVVVWRINSWDIKRYAQTAIKDHIKGELVKFPNAKGWAKDTEVSARFKDGAGPAGIHIGNGYHWNNELGHILTVGGAGMGKGTCLVLPALLSDGLVRSGTSVVCLDPKGENAAVAAPHFKRAGYDVHIINPFKIREVAHLGNSRWNPFDLVEDGEEKKFCDVLAAAIHNRKSGGDNEFFNARCRQYISLYARYVYHKNRHGLKEEGYYMFEQLYGLLLQTGQTRENLLAQMATDETFGGNAEAENILNRLMSPSIKTEDSIFSTIEEAVNILADERLQASLETSDFDLRQVAQKPTAIFICIRHDELRYYSMWLRMFTDVLLKTLNTYYNPARKVLVLLDEFAQLGYVEQFSHAPAVLRSYNVTLWPIVQHIGQLQKLYGNDHFETFIINSVVKHWFGGNGGSMDNATAEYIVKRLPKTVEIIHDDRGTPRGQERPLLDVQGVINYPHIIGEAFKLSAAFEIRKTPYWNLPFAKGNASPNPFYN